MFKEMGKVTETDCFDSCTFSKSHLALEKRNVKVKLCLRARSQEGPDFGIITLTQTLTQLDY
jgi:hypothetical protein